MRLIASIITSNINKNLEIYNHNLKLTLPYLIMFLMNPFLTLLVL